MNSADLQGRGLEVWTACAVWRWRTRRHSRRPAAARWRRPWRSARECWTSLASARRNGASTGRSWSRRWPKSRTSAARPRELFEYAPDAYVVTDLAGNILAANHAATLLFGAEGVPRRQAVAVLLSPRRSAGLLRPLGGTAQAANRPEAWEAHLATPPPGAAGGGRLERDHPEANGAGGRLALAHPRRDGAEQEAEEARRAAQVFNEGLLEAAQVLVLVIDRRTAVCCGPTPTSKRSRDIRGEELAGHDWRALIFDPNERPAFEGTVDGRRPSPVPSAVDTGGGRRAVAWSVRPLSNDPGTTAVTLAVGHDVTDLEEAQQKALRMERLAAIGQISAALAHESRNALQRGQALPGAAALEAGGPARGARSGSPDAKGAGRFGAALRGRARIRRPDPHRRLAVRPGPGLAGGLGRPAGVGRPEGRPAGRRHSGGRGPHLSGGRLPAGPGVSQHPGKRLGGLPRSRSRGHHLPRRGAGGPAGPADRRARQRAGFHGRTAAAAV